MKKYLVTILISLFATVQANAEDWVYTVRPKDSLQSIVDKYVSQNSYYNDILSYNDFDADHVVKPGTRIKIPFQWLNISPLSVTLTQLHGSVYKISQPQSNNQQAARLGELFHLGDALITGDNSTAVINFADGSIVEVKENTHIIFDLLNVYGESGMVDSKMLLNKGRVEINANPSHRQDGLYRFEVKTPLAISAVRGTKYGISADQDRSIVELRDGKTIVTPAVGAGISGVQSDEKNLELNKGYGTYVRTDGWMSPPLELLGKMGSHMIDTSLLEQGVRKISWLSNEQADQYYLQFATDKSFKNIIWTTFQKENELTPTFINNDITYFMKLASVDKNGLIGYSTVVELNPQLYPQAPTTITPSHFQFVSSEVFDFNWKAGSDEAFTVEIAKDDMFTDIVYSDEVLGAQQQIVFDESFENGVYYWRMKKQGDDGLYGEYGLVAPFYLQLHRDKKVVNEEDESLITLPDHDDIKGYRLQVFNSDSSADKIWDKTFIQNEVRLPNHIFGDLFYRVAIIDNEGYQAAYSEMKKVKKANPLSEIVLGWLP